MKNKISIVTILAILIIGTGITNAQNWTLTGNAGTNPANNFLGTTDAQALKIKTNNAVRINISSAGKIGIGNFSPVFKLDVKGGSVNTDSLYRINGKQVLNLNSSNQVQVGDATANVGIGTSTPGAKLEISGQIKITGGFPGSGKVLTSDANGLASWEVLPVVSGANSSLSNLTSTSINQSLFPGANGVFDLGDSVFSWKDVTCNGNYKLDGATFLSNGGISTCTFVGNTGNVINTGESNAFVGYKAGNKNTNGDLNTFIGPFAGFSNTSGDYNTFLGTYAGNNNNQGKHNTYLGSFAGVSENDTNSNGNVMVGSFCGLVLSKGTANVFLGAVAGENLYSGDSNTFLGNGAGIGSAGYNIGNTFVGANSGADNSDGIYNSFFGSNSGLTSGQGTYNTFMGYGADGSNGISNATAIGANAVVTANNSLVLGNNQNVGIGISAPVVKLHIKGGTDSEISGGGYIVNGDVSGTNLSIDDNEIMARDSGSGATIYINKDGGDVSLCTTNGNVGIGTNIPEYKLQITDGSDVQPAAGGFLVINRTNTTNIAIDDNEIMARNNGAAASLAVNNNGGNVTFSAADTGGKVGINLLNPSYHLQLSKNSAAKPTSSSWTVVSDERLKTKVQDFKDGLNIIEKIHPVWFNYNGKGGMPLNERGIGTLAQELQKIAPYMISSWKYTDEKSGINEDYLGVDYGAMDFLLTNSIVELKKMVDEKDSRLADLENRLAQLERDLSQCCMSTQHVVIPVTGMKENYNGFSDSPHLEQNNPNPFYESTVIRFYIPADCKVACLKIYSATGIEIKKISISSRGIGQIELEARTLTSGIYTYSLEVNDKTVDVKQMVITR